MIRQYKSTEEELSSHVAHLQTKSDENKLMIYQLQEKKKKVDEEAKNEIAKKDDLIRELTQQIEQMTTSFSKMLGDTLQKMKERINAANEQWKEENEAKNQFKIDSIIDPDRVKS